MEAELMNKLAFLSGFAVAFKEQIHTDVQLKPGEYGPSIPAHKALLAARSKIFKNMLDSDECMAPTSDPITLPELNYEELESLLEFLYGGTLPTEKMQRHVKSLLLAAYKYEIPYLQEFCRRHILGSLNSSNALDFLELSDISSDYRLKNAALNFIVKHMEEIITPAEYELFARRNPHLSVQITRAFVVDTKSSNRVIPTQDLTTSGSFSLGSRRSFVNDLRF